MSILDPESEQYKTLRFNALREKAYIALIASDVENQYTYADCFKYATEAAKAYLEELEKL